MSGQNEHSNKHEFSAEDIRRYLAGEMSPAGMHELEQASLEDPMLGDALEGMREVKANTGADLDALRTRLAQRVAEKERIIPLWRSWPKWAAAAAVLVGLSGLGYFFVTHSRTENAIAAAPPIVVPGTPPAQQDAAPSASLPTYADSERAAPVPEAGSRPVKAAKAATSPSTRPKHGVMAGNDRRAENGQPEPAKEKETSAKDEDLAINRAVALSPALAPVADSAFFDKRIAGIAVRSGYSKAAASPISYSGKVVDESGNAIAGAEVRMGKESTSTDIQGKFTLSAAPADSSQLDFSSVGYQSQTLMTDGLHPGDLTVKLNSSSASLSEVVVTGYGSQRKKYSAPTPSPIPQKGWKQYRSYLGANKIQPTIDSSLHGTERVTFSVTKNGEAVDFSVDESLSIEHDSVAIRIIRNGPKWKPAKDTARRVSLALPY